MTLQQGDVLLRQTDDDGDITSTDGIIEMTAGFETAAYISLFGGNFGDDGSDGSRAQWWGNLSETDPDMQYRGETETLLESLPAIPANLRRVEQAALRDLSWFQSKKVANRVEVTATMPGVDRVKLAVIIEANGNEMAFEFTENWKAAA